MSNQKQACFDDVQFHRFLENESDMREEAKIMSHIETCEQCQAALENLAGHQQVWGDIKDHLAERSSVEETHDHLGSDNLRDLRKVKEMLGPTDNPKMIGRLGGYEICGMIGRGSAGIVVKALDTRLNRYVAIKLLAPVYSNNGSSRRRFEREGRAIASVKDNNVIPVYAVGDFNGTPFIVMQYLPDGSLLQRIEREGPLTTREAACVGMQVARGLAAAHKRGIVHRDVKPANVLLESGIDCAMVTDFGLARVVDEATMTRSGAISGTPQYMSPEQAMGESVDPRSDLFSLGSVMYAACTGHSPFRSETVFGVIKRVCESEPKPILDLNSDVAPWMVAFINKLHSKSRENRFDSADQVAELLSEELAHMQSPNMVPEPAREWWDKPVAQRSALLSRPANWVVAALTAAVLLGCIGWGMFGPEADNQNPLIKNGPLSSLEGPSALAVAPELSAAKESIIYLNPGQFSPEVLLNLLTEENKDMPQFDRSVETTIDVQDGGRLFLRTNLGGLMIRSHDEPTVKMNLVHKVSAKDKEFAAKLFKAVELNYDHDHSLAEGQNLRKGKDAVIVAKFPIQKLTEEEIEASGDLDELKEQILIRNNSHYRNVKFELLIPSKFNLDLATQAGPVEMEDVDGNVTVLSNGGHIEFGDIEGKVVFESQGGHIEGGDLGADATLKTSGGHIETGDVAGNLFAHTQGGHISIEDVDGTTDAKTMGGNVAIERAVGPIKAETMGGGVTVWKAESEVDLKASAGKIYVNFIKQPKGDSKLIADAGSISVGYLDGMSFDIDASAMSGSISAPFAEKRTRTLVHKLNDGANKLSVISSIGGIDFHKTDVDEIDQQVEQNEARQAGWEAMRKGERAFQKAYDLHMEGKIDEAMEAHKFAATFDGYRGIATYNLGCAWSLKGDVDKAFETLNKAIDLGFDDYNQFQTDSDLDSLREDKRYDEMMERIKSQNVSASDCDDDCECDEACECECDCECEGAEKCECECHKADACQCDHCESHECDGSCQEGEGTIKTIIRGEQKSIRDDVIITTASRSSRTTKRRR